MSLPVVTLFIFGVHQLLNALPFIYFFLPFPIRPTFSIVLQYQHPIYKRASVLCTQRGEQDVKVSLALMYLIMKKMLICGDSKQIVLNWLKKKTLKILIG